MRFLLAASFAIAVLAATPTAGAQDAPAAAAAPESADRYVLDEYNLDLYGGGAPRRSRSG